MNIAFSKYIAAKVILTGEIIQVDDVPVAFGFFRCYCPWHCTEDGTVYHDDELEFLEERLQ